MPRTKLDNQNYFTPQNNMRFMSVSQYKDFDRCEASALYKLNNAIQTEPTPAMLIGSYVDAYFSGELDDFKSNNPELFKRDGSLKSDFIQADYIIERIKRDEMMMRYLSGENQVVMTGTIEGVPIKVKIDSFHKGIAIVDLKVMKDFAPIWSAEYGCKQNFITAWRYELQLAVYQEIARQNTKQALPCYIVAATREKEPDIAIVQIEQNRLNEALVLFKATMPRYAQLKQGIGEPIRCERCDYCKATKQARVMTLEQFDMEVNG